MNSTRTIRAMAALGCILVCAPAVSGQQAQREPAFIKIVRDIEEQEKEKQRSQIARDKAERDYLQSRIAAGSAEPGERAAADQRTQQAGAALDDANAGVNRATDTIHQLEGRAVNAGYLVPLPEGENPLLKPKRPVISEDKPTLDLLKKIAKDPDSVPGNVEGNTRKQGTPTPTVVKPLMTKAEIAAQLANIRQAQFEAEEDLRALMAENAENIAAVQNDVQNSRALQALIAEINAHVDAAQLVDRSNNAAIEAYNAKTDRLYYRYKQLTGKDIGYRFER